MEIIIIAGVVLYIFSMSIFSPKKKQPSLEADFGKNFKLLISEAVKEAKK